MSPRKKLDLPTSAVGRNAPNSGGVNEAPPMAERSPEVRSRTQSGPNIGPAGEYLPAAYTMDKVVRDGKDTVNVSLLREDR